MMYALFCAGLMAASAVPAMEVADPVGAALQGIDPAGSSCRRDEAPVQGMKTSQAGIADLSCALSVTELSSRRAGSLIHIIDTRSPAEFSAGRVDAAINLSWGDVRARSYLKNRPIVLMGSGKDDESLYAGCGVLKSDGITDVRVVRGGVAAWVAAGLPIVGAALDHEPLNELNDEQLMHALEFPANLVFATPDAKGFSSVTPRAIVLRRRGGDAIRSMLAERAKQIGSIPFASIVLLPGASPNAAELSSLVRGASPHPVLIYRGSAQEYSAFVSTRRAVWLAQARGPKGLPCSSR